MEAKEISVIIPVYGVEDYLDECLESVVGQTYKNLEIILVDDGSKDNCPAMCDAWAKKDSRIQVIHKENGGVSSARNRGFECATGDYVIFIDSDDLLHLEMLETLAKPLNEYPDVDGAFCGFSSMMENGEILQEIFKQTHDQCVDRVSAAKKVIGKQYYDVLSCNKLFRRSILQEISPLYDETIRYGEDTPWITRVLKNARKIYLSSKILFYYRKRPGSTTYGNRFDEKRLGEYKAQHQMLDAVKQYGDQELINIAKIRFYIWVSGIWRMVYQTGNQKLADQMAEELREPRKLWLEQEGIPVWKNRRLWVDKMIEWKFPKKFVHWVDTI